MRRMLMLAPLFLSLSLQAEELRTFKCVEILPPTLSEAMQYRKVIEIIETKDVTLKQRELKPKKSIDAAHSVTVRVLSEAENGTVSLLHQYDAVSITSDVYYEINTLRTNKINLFMYLDEMNQAGMQYTDVNTGKKNIKLECAELSKRK